jgi:hypothetical protein
LLVISGVVDLHACVCVYWLLTCGRCISLVSHQPIAAACQPIHRSKSLHLRRLKGLRHSSRCVVCPTLPHLTFYNVLGPVSSARLPRSALSVHQLAGSLTSIPCRRAHYRNHFSTLAFPATMWPVQECTWQLDTLLAASIGGGALFPWFDG